MPNSSINQGAKRTHWRTNLLLVLGAVAISFLILEFVARLLLPTPLPWLYPQLRYQPDTDLIFKLVPNQNSFTADKPVVLNEHGLRGSVVPFARNAGNTRILFLGDSITFGYGVNDKEVVTEQIPGILQNHGVTAEVINTAVPSYNTEQEVMYLAKEGIQYKPDWVVVGVCWNDVNEKSGVRVNSDGYLISHEAEDKQRNWLALAMESHTGYKLRNFVKQSRLLLSIKLGWNALASGFRTDSHTNLRNEVLTGQKTSRVMNGWNHIANALERLDDMAHTHEFRTLVVAFPVPLALQKSYPDSSYPRILNEITAAAGIPFIDLEPSFRSMYKTHESLFIPYDGDHPNAAGHKLAAQVIAEYLATHADREAAQQNDRDTVN